jgi:5-methylcytosine-specific restriction endonuclease McrA
MATKPLSEGGIMRCCNKCGEIKPIGEFKLVNKKTGRRRLHCNDCERKYQREYKAKNSDRVNAYQRAWSSENREKETARHKRYVEKNRELISALQRAYAATEKGMSVIRKYRLKNKERYQANDHNRKKKRRARMHGGRVTVAEWIEIKARYKSRCVYCGSRQNITMDHIVPLAKGGRHEPTNIQTACRRCNTRKSATDPIVFAQRIGRLL